MFLSKEHLHYKNFNIIASKWRRSDNKSVLVHQ